MDLSEVGRSSIRLKRQCENDLDELLRDRRLRTPPTCGSNFHAFAFTRGVAYLGRGMFLHSERLSCRPDLGCVLELQQERADDVRCIPPVADYPSRSVYSPVSGEEAG